MSTPPRSLYPTNPTRQAGLWMLGAILSFSSMAVAGREAGRSLPTIELLLYRSLIGIVIVLLVAGLAGTLNQINRQHFKLHVLRNVFHFSGQTMWYFAITIIPLAQVFAFEFTSPLWVIALSPLLLGERLTPRRVLAGLLGFVGILIIARPGASTLNIGILAAAASAIGFAATAIFTKQLTTKASLTCILFWLVLLQALFALILAAADGHIALPAPAIWPWLGLIGIAGLSSHFCLTKALSIAPASTVMPFDFARLPLIAIVGMLFYDEPLDLFTLLGAAVIFTANSLNLRRSAP
ncbi:MAG: EamA family transporter [Rhodobacterales bacterium]|nr:MAG: EamA family transporter [Rhodobacterales bacterium]